MEFTQLSLSRGQYGDGKSSDVGQTGPPMKRKWESETPCVDLQVKHPLPSDWEQCLDLQSGRMYYVNRKTCKRSWSRPEEQQLDLELNIGHSRKEEPASPMTNMVALACSNCHLLVILSRSSPSCPNCKYVHLLPSTSAAGPF